MDIPLTDDERPLRLESSSEEDGALRLSLVGSATMPHAGALWRELLEHADAGDRPVRIDLDEVDRLDGAGAATLLELQCRLVARGIDCRITGGREGVRRVLAIYDESSGAPCLKPAPARRPILDQVGEGALEAAIYVKEILHFIGEVLVAAVAACRTPRTIHWRSVGPLMEQAGADGLPISGLINFLVGLIMGFQAAIQLQRFGADIFIADLVGLSMTRELGPLMTAIIVAGRSGAAFAAELGTMKVSEEIDALRTLGLDPQRFLVFPRVIALAAMVPLLTIIGDFLGCAGGLVIAVTKLGLPPRMYMSELEEAVDLWDIGGGLVKSVVFAVVITFISCQRGLATRGGAAGVGSSTTSAVVLILFSLVALDTVFSVVYDLLGI